MHEEVETEVVEQNGYYTFSSEVDTTRFMAEWTSKYGISCDLDLHVYCYDERARFIEKLDSELRSSRDGSCNLVSNLEASAASNSFFECVSIDFESVDSATTAILLFLDGGPRNFQFVSSVSVSCLQVPSSKKEVSFLPDHEKKIHKLFQMNGRARKDYQGMALCALYKDGWIGDKPQWVTKSILEPVNLSNAKDKDDRCAQLVIGAVPALEKFRPRLFATVGDICAALSSRSLPRLKRQFQKAHEGLDIGKFTEVLFKQLYESHPKIGEENESAYTVAMIQEMFSQIDYNGDASVDWDEFTSFCIQTGMGDGNTHSADNEKASNIRSLDEYVIEYGEDVLMRDRVLSSHRRVDVMRHFADSKKIAVINEDSEKIVLLDERFKLLSEILPSKVQIVGTVVSKVEKQAEAAPTVKGHHRSTIYDVVYLTGRDMYAFCASDHALTVCKEQISMGGQKTNYVQHNKFYHPMLHLKLCWSASAGLLCSIASDKTIYGWDIDRTQPLFQISRHSDIITDFISVDHMEIFVTCSMDKRIVMWSAVTRRVKGIFLGHKRGVRSLSYHENILLSAGFETEAKTWDMVAKDPIAVLRGHRQPIRTAQLMCKRAQSEKDYRAITVDETGEFRLWNIYVKERISEPTAVPCLQIFEMNSPESPLNEIHFLAVPNNPRLSTGYYSDLIACGTKLLHFVPEKNAKEFVPPTACIFNESSTSVVTAVGKGLMKYDVCNGNFIAFHQDLHTHELTALCLDGKRGRRMFIGCSDGSVLLVNYMMGAIIAQIEAHSKEITCIEAMHSQHNKIYTGSLDGKLKILEESGGDLRVHNSVEMAFDGLGVSNLVLVRSLRALVASAVGNQWGVWHDSTLKKMLLVTEESVVHAIAIIGASGDEQDPKPTTPGIKKVDPRHSHLLTVAVALVSCVRVYTINLREVLGIVSYQLSHDSPMYITDMRIMRSPQSDCVNYATTRQNASLVVGNQLIATTDDGKIILWDMNGLRRKSEAKFKQVFPGESVNAARRTSAPLSVPGVSIRAATAASANVLSPMANGAITAAGMADLFEGGQADASSAPNAASGAGPLTVEVSGEAGVWGPDTGGIGAEHSNFSPSKDGPPTAGSAFLTSLGGPAHAASKTAQKGPAVNVSSSLFLSAHGSTLDILEHRPSSRSWSGHNDFVSALCPLHDHGCFATVSHDGYHRVWNIDCDSLGELPLPNLTETMKAPPVRVGECKGWRFILERIPVTHVHREVAAWLVQTIVHQNDSLAPTTDMPGRRTATAKLTDSPTKSLQALTLETSVDGTDEGSKARTMALLSLTEAPSLPTDAPPSRLLTKDEKKFLALSESLAASQAAAGHRSLLSLAASSETESLDSETLSQAMGIGGGGVGFSSAAAGGRATAPSGLLDRSMVKSTSAKNIRGHAATGAIDSPTDTDGSPRDFSMVMGGQMFDSIGTLGAGGVGGAGGTQLMGKSTKSARQLWDSAEDYCNSGVSRMFVCNAAFSEGSISVGRHDGYIDSEGDRILKRIASQPDKVSVYERAQPVILLRNAKLSCSVKMPKIDTVRRAEVNFGEQKDMYKNADKYLKERDRLSKPQMLNAITLARIERNVKKVNKMVHILPPPSHDEVVLPKNSTTDGTGERGKDPDAERAEQRRMQMRLMQSASMVPYEASLHARPLDMATMERCTEKVKVANEFGNDTYKPTKKEKKKKTSVSHGLKDALEHKLFNSIKDAYKARQHMFAAAAKASRVTIDDDGQDRPVTPMTPSKKMLTTRILLPYYTIEDVHHFMDIFAKVDEDFSGDLDIHEWVRLFATINHNIPAQEARMIFMKVDRDADGFISMKDLIPVVFNKANKEQMRLITIYAESELVKKHDGMTFMTSTEVDQLFECYDTDNIGFVPIQVIRDRIKSFGLNEGALFQFLDTIVDIESDEMINQIEFLRIMKPYLLKEAREIEDERSRN